MESNATDFLLEIPCADLTCRVIFIGQSMANVKNWFINIFDGAKTMQRLKPIECGSCVPGQMKDYRHIASETSDANVYLATPNKNMFL